MSDTATIPEVNEWHTSRSGKIKIRLYSLGQLWSPAVTGKRFEVYAGRPPRRFATEVEARGYANQIWEAR
jgi:hypothetical protein